MDSFCVANVQRLVSLGHVRSLFRALAVVSSLLGGDLGALTSLKLLSPEVQFTAPFCQSPLSWKAKRSSLLGKIPSRWPSTYSAHGKLAHPFVAKRLGVQSALPTRPDISLEPLSPSSTNTTGR